MHHLNKFLAFPGVEDLCFHNPHPQRSASYINASIEFYPIEQSISEIEDAVKKLSLTQRYEDYLYTLFQYLDDFRQNPNTAVLKQYLDQNPQFSFEFTGLLQDYISRFEGFHSQYFETQTRVISRVFRRFSATITHIFCDTVGLWGDLCQQSSHPALALYNSVDHVKSALGRYIPLLRDYLPADLNPEAHLTLETVEKLELCLAALDTPGSKPLEYGSYLSQLEGVVPRHLQSEWADILTGLNLPLTALLNQSTLKESLGESKLLQLYKKNTLLHLIKFAQNTAQTLEPSSIDVLLLGMHIRGHVMSAEVEFLKKHSSAETLQALVEAVALKSEEALQALEKWAGKAFRQDSLHPFLERVCGVIRLSRFLNLTYDSAINLQIKSLLLTQAAKRYFIDSAYITLLNAHKQADFFSVFEKLVPIFQEVSEFKGMFPPVFLVSLFYGKNEADIRSDLQQYAGYKPAFEGKGFSELMQLFAKDKGAFTAYYLFYVGHAQYAYQGTSPPSFERFEAIMCRTAEGLARVCCDLDVFQTLGQALFRINSNGKNFVKALENWSNPFERYGWDKIESDRSYAMLDLKATNPSTMLLFHQKFELFRDLLFRYIELSLALKFLYKGLRISQEKHTITANQAQTLLDLLQNSIEHLHTCSSTTTLSQVMTPSRNALHAGSTPERIKFSPPPETVRLLPRVVSKKFKEADYFFYQPSPLRERPVSSQVTSSPEQVKREISIFFKRLCTICDARHLISNDPNFSLDLSRDYSFSDLEAAVQASTCTYRNAQTQVATQLDRVLNTQPFTQKYKFESGAALKDVSGALLSQHQVSLQDLLAFFDSLFKANPVEWTDSHDPMTLSFKALSEKIGSGFARALHRAERHFDNVLMAYSPVHTRYPDMALEFIESTRIGEKMRFADGAHCCNTSDPALWEEEGHVGAGMYEEEIHRWLADPTTLFFQVIEFSDKKDQKNKQVGWLKIGMALNAVGEPGLITNLLYLVPKYHQEPLLHAAIWRKIEEMFFAEGFLWIAQSDPIHWPSNTIRPLETYTFDPHFSFNRLQALQDEKLESGGYREIKFDRSYPGNVLVNTSCFLKKNPSVFRQILSLDVYAEADR